MWNYHPDVVVETFVRFNPRAGRSRSRSCTTTMPSSLPPTTRSSPPRCSARPAQSKHVRQVQAAADRLRVAGRLRRRRGPCGGRVRPRAQPGRDRLKSDYWRTP